MLAINIEDVISVLNTCKPYLIGFGVVVVLAILAMIACLKLPRSKKFVIRGTSALAIVLALVVTVNLIVMGPMYTMVSLAMGNGSVSEETAESAKTLANDIAEEGVVMVKNTGGLPLANTKVNVFGWSSTNPVYGGTGSGSMSDAYPTVSFLDGLTNAGIEYNTTITDFYTNFRDARPNVGMMGQDWTIPEPTMEEYDQAGIFENAASFSDTAIIFLARSGGEGADLPTSYDGEDTFVDNGSGGMFGASGVRYSSQTDDLDANKHYLELSNREQAMVERVTSQFDNVIVIINSANAMELGFLNQYDSITGALVLAGPGQTGFNAVGSILAGDVNPSGKLVDTYVKDLTQTPTWNNFGQLDYDNMDEFAVDGNLPSFVNYVEGIYVGYKFYETAAVEGLINYDDVVLYPFGYGLSYTTFTQNDVTMEVINGVVTIDVTVTNIGDVAGKDVVQIYYNPPYTNGGIEKASANLIAFDKTDLLQPGETQTVTLTFNLEDMASYDAYREGCYVLEAGEYTISVNSDSHTVLASLPYTVDTTVVYDENNPRSTDEVAAVNQFDYAQGEVTYLSRADGFANYAAATATPATFSMPESQKATFLNNSNYDPNNYNNPDDVMPTTGAKNGLSLVDLRGVDYDDPKWDQLLDQLTVTEMDKLIALGGYSTVAISSIDKVQTIDCDGPASINNNFTGAGSIGFPAAVMIASTWNVDLAYDFGDSIGQMADEMGVSGWYAPAMNTHRSAFSGRNFEYYSEDGVISGYMAANAILGAKEHGVYAYMKHFALNDQETNRCEMLCTWANEQSIREIYLKPFEISVKEGGCQAVMSAFNYIGTVWAGSSPALLNTVLRDEWGFQGMVLTDYFGVYGYMDSDQAIRGGTDCMLVAYDTETNHVTDTKSATSVLAMRQASKNILFTTVNSRAYNPENLDTGMQSWQIALIAIDVVIAVVLVAGMVAIIKKSRKIAD